MNFRMKAGSAVLAIAAASALAVPGVAMADVTLDDTVVDITTTTGADTAKDATAASIETETDGSDGEWDGTTLTYDLSTWASLSSVTVDASNLPTVAETHTLSEAGVTALDSFSTLDGGLGDITQPMIDALSALQALDAGADLDDTTVVGYLDALSSLTETSIITPAVVDNPSTAGVDETAAAVTVSQADVDLIDDLVANDSSYVTTTAAYNADSIIVKLPASYMGSVHVTGAYSSLVSFTGATASDLKMSATISLTAANIDSIESDLKADKYSQYSELNVTFNDKKLDEDDIKDFLDDYGKDITGKLIVNNSDIEELDVSNVINATALEITAGDLTDLNGLNDFGSKKGSGSVTMTIDASELDSIDFSDNDAIGNIKLTSKLESVDVSGLEHLAILDVSGCTDLTSLDISNNDKLGSLNISGTHLAYLDTSETAITKKITSGWAATGTSQGLYAGEDGLELEDNQYASVTENDDDDDYNDYIFDLDNITDGNGELVSVDAKNFTIITTNSKEVRGDMVEGDKVNDVTVDMDNIYTDDDWFDFDDGELTITAKDAPKSITYTVATDDDQPAVTYTVQFDVQSEGDRISGDDRYDTMVQINTDEGDKDFDDAERFDESDGNIVVASGEGYADALSASALAGALNTGIVTTATDSLTDDTIDMLDDMNEDQQTAYIVGGTSAVSYAVEQQLTDLGFSIKRFAGSDRFETAVDVQDTIQDWIDDVKGDDGETTVTNDKTVIIASGVNFADALAISPYAYTQNIPIVLVGADGEMDDDTAGLFNKYKKDYSRAIIVGGTAVVSDDVIDTLEGYDMDVIRLAGSDRFETNLVINDWLDRGDSSISPSDDIFEAAGYSKDDIEDFNDADINAFKDANDFDGQAYVVTGLNYADALAVAPLAGLKNGTINMVSSDDITTVTEAKDNEADTTIIGGTSAISSDLADEIEDL